MRSAARIQLIITVAVVLSLVLGVVGIVLLESGARRLEAKRQADFQRDTAELVRERQELEIEYANIDKVALDAIENGSYIGFLFTEITPDLYDLFSYHFKDRLDYAGMMCISDSAMPGNTGTISMQQFLEMTAFGWQYAIYWDGETNLAEYLTAMKELCRVYGMEVPDTVVFRQGCYTVDYDATLEHLGFSNAIHHGEEKRNIIERGVDEGIWHPGALGWNTLGYSNAMLVEIINHGGVAFFEVNFSGGHEIYYDKTVSQRVEGFDRMLAAVEACIESDEVRVTDLATAREGRRDYLAAEEEVLAYIEVRRVEILDRMNEIDLEIANVYKSYFG